MSERALPCCTFPMCITMSSSLAYNEPNMMEPVQIAFTLLTKWPTKPNSIHLRGYSTGHTMRVVQEEGSHHIPRSPAIPLTKTPQPGQVSGFS